MANVQGMCSSFKKELMSGSHALGAQAANATRTVTTADVFKGALFLATASRGAADTVYSTTGELAGTGNYTQGGATITNANAPAVSGTAAIWTPSASLSWANLTSSGSFDTLVIYNSSSTAGLEVGVYTFSPQSITAGTFTLTMPVNGVGTALVQIT
jgi:hypothetical protein